MDKKILRKTLMKKRNSLSETEIQDSSKILSENLYKLDLFKNSNNIFIFVSYKSEIHTHNIIKYSIKHNKNIYIPVVDPKTKTMKASRLRDFSNLEENYMNILEPRDEYIEFVPSDIIDLAIVPGLLFDKSGYRIGYGGGYYDKFFADLKGDVIKLGIGYDFQFTNETIIHSEYDMPVNYFLSEKKFYIL